MKQFITVATGLLATLFAASANGQATDHPSCAPWKAKWAEVSGGADLAAMDGVIGNIPGLCPALKAEAATRRADAVKQAEQVRAAAAQQQAANEAARRANDPCQQARNDWEYARTAGEDAVRAYRKAVPAQCTMWIGEADTRIRMLEGARLSAERADASRVAEEADKKRRENERTANLAAAAKALGVEGRWEVVASPDDMTCSKEHIALWMSVEDGAVVSRQGDIEAPHPILEADSDRIVTANWVYTVRHNVKTKYGGSGTVLKQVSAVSEIESLLCNDEQVKVAARLNLDASVAAIISANNTGKYESSCRELSRTLRGELRNMLNDGKRTKRRLVVLETGSERSDACKTHWLDEAAYASFPTSIRPLCALQARQGDIYCWIYSIDGNVTKQLVPEWPDDPTVAALD